MNNLFKSLKNLSFLNLFFKNFKVIYLIDNLEYDYLSCLGCKTIFVYYIKNEYQKQKQFSNNGDKFEKDFYNYLFYICYNNSPIFLNIESLIENKKDYIEVKKFKLKKIDIFNGKVYIKFMI